MSRFIVGNWKMNMDLKSASALAAELIAFSHNTPVSCTVVVCPPFPYLGMAALTFLDSSLQLGAQDCSDQNKGAFTGQVSASMLKDLSCTYVILGHSERRALLKENNEVIKQKAQQALQEKIIPIICIGENEEQRAQNQAVQYVLDQAKHSCPDNGPYILAYEPVWAIGSGKIPTLDEITEIHQALMTQHPGCPILYGGSVNLENSSDILGLPCVAGVLVGGVSLKAQEFWKIAQNASEKVSI